MGLFFNSDTQNKKSQILSDVLFVNGALISICTTLDNNGMNSNSIHTISPVMTNMEPKVTRISTTVNSMSESQLQGFTVPWTDGKHVGIMTWLFNLINFSKVIEADIETYKSSRFG